MASTARRKSYAAIARKYAEDVTKGRIPACAWVRRACKRHLRDLTRSREKRYPYRFDATDAWRACHFIELLPHIKGDKAGQPIVLEPWEVFVVAVIFGWLVRATKKRRFRRVYIEVPRGNGKSTLAAAIGLFLLICDGEGGAEIYSAATKKDQAKIVWGVAHAMLQKSPDLCAHFGVEVRTHDILVPALNGKFVPLASDEDSLDGLNIHAGLIDELHAHKTRGVYDVLETGSGKRSQSLLMVITTAGADRAGICYEVRGHAAKVLEGVDQAKPAVQDEQLFAIIYTIDNGEEDTWDDITLYRKANPNWGVSVDIPFIEGLIAKASHDARSRNTLQTKHLNVWINAESAWMEPARWEQCRREGLRIEDFRGCESIVAIDLASKLDLAAVMRVFRRFDRADQKPSFYAFGRYYVPQVRADAVRDTYAGWARSGWIIATPGEVNDFDTIRDTLLEELATYETKEFAMDPANAPFIANKLQEHRQITVEVPQRVLHLSPAMKEIEGLVAERRIHHNGDPVLAWAMANVVCHEDANDNIFPRKDTAAKKIDPAVALIIAMCRWMAQPKPEPSVYEGRGLIALG